MKLGDVSDVAEMLGVDEKTVYGWVSLDRVPYYKLSKAVRFDLEEVEEWAKTCRKGPKIVYNEEPKPLAGRKGEWN